MKGNEPLVLAQLDLYGIRPHVYPYQILKAIRVYRQAQGSISESSSIPKWTQAKEQWGWTF